MVLETGSIARRTSFRPVVAALLIVAAVALALAVTRPQAAPLDRPSTSASWMADRVALAEAGFTGRLGGVSPADWTQAAEAAGFTGRVGAATTPADWTERAAAAGFTGRLG